MERSHFIIDSHLYSADVIARTVHRYTGDFGVELRRHDSGIEAVFWSLDGSELPDDLWTRLSRDLLDERLRAVVRAETAGLQQELLRAALIHARPVDAHVEV